MPERQPGDIEYRDYFYLTDDCYVLIYLLSTSKARITDIAKLDGKLDSENSARKSEIAALDRYN